MITLLSILFFVCVIYWCLNRRDKTKIVFIETERNKALLDRCKAMRVYDRIPIWGLNGHIQSYFASQIRKGPTYPFKREVLSNLYGGSFAIDWFVNEQEFDPNFPIVCILPGIAGHIGNDYIKNFIHYCKKQRFNVVSWNWPGCGDGNMLTHPRMTTYGDSNDLLVLTRHIKSKYPQSKLYMVGFSLGANLLLRHMGEVGNNTPIDAAVTFSAGYCGRTGLALLKRNTIYSRVLVKKWIEVIMQNEHVYKEVPEIDLDQIKKAKSLEEFDKSFLQKVLNIDNLDEYYQSHSSLPWLEHIARPTLLLNALDDPIVKTPLVKLAKEAVTKNENLILAHTKYGGHMGWVQAEGISKPNKMLWMDRVAIEFVRAVENVLK